MAIKTNSEVVGTSAGVQAYSTTSGYLGNYIVRYYITTLKDTTIQVESSSDGLVGFTRVGETFAVKNDTIDFWIYDGGYQRVCLLLEDVGSDTATVAYQAIQPYVTPTEVRNYTKLQDIEYTDIQLLEIIHNAMGEIHERTGRIWYGEETVTNQLLTGSDGDECINLPNVDIQSITAFSIDDDNDGIYTNITTSTLRWSKEGVVQLSDSSEVSKFPGEVDRVMVSYSYGNQKPTGEVRRLTLDIVKRLLTNDPDLERQIQAKVNKLSYSNISIV